MAIGMIFQGAGITREQYDQLHNAASPGNGLPPGAISHIAGMNEGGVVVIEIWESMEVVNQFFQENAAIIAAAGVTAEPIVFEVFNIVQ